MSRVVALALASLIAAIGAATADARPAAVVDCNAWASYLNIKISSARNMICRAAVVEMRRYRGQIFRRFRTPGGFTCTRVSGGTFGGQWRCVRASQAFRFDFGD